MKKHHVYIAYTVLLLALFSPLLARQVEPRWDAEDFIYPSFVYMADSIREGRWPLWDPYTNCGYPFHAEPQYPTLNPVALILGSLLSDTALGFLLYWLFYWWWGGIGMARLAFHLGAGPAGALLSTLSFSFSGYFLGHASHTTWLFATAWLPWIVLFADKAVATSSAGYALLAGFAAGLSTLGAYSAFAAFNGFACILWLVLRYLWPAGGDRRPLRARAGWVLGTILTMGVVSLLAWSPVLYSFFVEARTYTERVSASFWNQGFGEPFTWQAHFSLLSPYSTILGRDWMGATHTMTNGYLGIVSIPLAAYWWCKGTGVRRPWWILGFFVFMYLASLGENAGVRWLIHYAYPPARYLRYSAPLRIYWIFPLALAAGLGLTKLRERPEHRKFAAILAGGWLAASIAACAILSTFLPSNTPYVIGRFLRLYFPVALILPGFVAVLWFWSKRGNAVREGIVTAALLVLMTGDFALHFISSRETVWHADANIAMAESLHRRDTRVAGEPGARLPPHPYDYFNAYLVTKQPAVNGYVTMYSPGFDEILCKSPFAQRLQSSRRFWVSPGAARSPGDNEVVSMLSRVGIDDNVPVFMEVPPEGVSSAFSKPGGVGEAKVLSYGPERIEMIVYSPFADGGILASTERYSPSWKAWVDGARQNVERINVYFRGILVPAGWHKVVWIYDPAYWTPLVVVSGLSLFLAGCIGTWLILRRRDRAGHEVR